MNADGFGPQGRKKPDWGLIPTDVPWQFWLRPSGAACGADFGGFLGPKAGDLHPADLELSEGTPGLGRPRMSVELAF
jgi:hypothetical protein